MKYILLSKVVGSFIRHGATAIGGWLLAQGYADESTVGQITGGVVALGGVVLSVAEKRNYRF